MAQKEKQQICPLEEVFQKVPKQWDLSGYSTMFVVPLTLPMDLLASSTRTDNILTIIKYKLIGMMRKKQMKRKERQITIKVFIPLFLCLCSSSLLLIIERGELQLSFVGLVVWLSPCNWSQIFKFLGFCPGLTEFGQ